MENLKERSFGIVPIFKDSQNNLYFCLIQHAGEHWGFPKGHKDEGENDLETALRELREETGIEDVSVLDKKSFTENYIFEKDGIKHDKSVEYFIGFVKNMKTDIPENFKEEISDIKWLRYKEAWSLITFGEAKRILNEVVNFLI